MQYCISGIGKICNKGATAIEEWWNSSSTLLDKCCKATCIVVGGCGLGISKCVAGLCKKPFSFCAFLTFLLAVFPISQGAITLFDAGEVTCKKPIKVSMIVIMICHAMNFMFFMYVTLRYGKIKNKETDRPPQTGIDEESLERDEGLKGENILIKTVNTINYDYGVCLYTFFALFCFVWGILAAIWQRTEPVTSVCRTTSQGEMVRDTHGVLLGVLWLYLFLGGIITTFSLLVFGCSEGSCIGWDTIRCCFIFMSCGQVDIANNSERGAEMLATSKERYAKNLKSYNEHRRKWIFRSLNILINFGIGTFPKVTKETQQKEKLRAPPSGKPQLKNFYEVAHQNSAAFQMRQNNNTVRTEEMRLATSIGNPAYIGPEPHPLGYSPNSIQPQMPRPKAPSKATQNVPKIKRFDQI